MRMRSRIALLTFALAVGLALPFLAAALQDIRLESSVLPLSEEAHYAYQGTLLNRVLALNAQFNRSPAVRKGTSVPADPPEGLLPGLLSLLPEAAGSVGEADVSAESEAFSIYPQQYEAEYRYISTNFTADSLNAHVISDAETGLPLRIELQLASPDSDNLLRRADLWQLLRAYGDLLDLGEVTDGDTSISDAIRSQSGGLRMTPYTAKVTLIPSAGSMLFHLTGEAAFQSKQKGYMPDIHCIYPIRRREFHEKVLYASAVFAHRTALPGRRT